MRTGRCLALRGSGLEDKPARECVMGMQLGVGFDSVQGMLTGGPKVLPEVRVVTSCVRLRDMLCKGQQHGGPVCGVWTGPGGWREAWDLRLPLGRQVGSRGTGWGPRGREALAGPRASATAPGWTLSGVPGLRKTSLPESKGIAVSLPQLCREWEALSISRTKRLGC